MKKVLSALCALVLVSCTFNVNLGGKKGKNVTCKGPVITQSLELADFNAIEVNGHADIKFLQKIDGYKVDVKANEEVFQYLNYRVENGTLILETVDKVNIRAEEFDVYIGAPTLCSFVVNGAADAEIVAVNQPEKLEIEINGAGDIQLKDIMVPELNTTINGAGDLEARALNVGKLRISVHGAGDVELAGKADSCELDVSGAGDIDARKLACEQFTTHKAGLASIKTK